MGAGGRKPTADGAAHVARGDAGVVRERSIRRRASRRRAVRAIRRRRFAAPTCHPANRPRYIPVPRVSRAQMPLMEYALARRRRRRRSTRLYQWKYYYGPPPPGARPYEYCRSTRFFIYLFFFVRIFENIVHPVRSVTTVNNISSERPDAYDRRAISERRDSDVKIYKQ